MTNQDLTIKSFIEQNSDQMIALLEDIITKGQMERLFNKDQNAHFYAVYLHHSIQGLKMTGILNQNEDLLRNIAKTILAILIKN